jgi:hypothetical protein
MADPLPRQDIPEVALEQFVVLFAGLTRASNVVASLAARLPTDVVPLPTRSLESLYARGRPTVSVSGIVLCVPRGQLSDVDRAVLNDLERVLPIYSTCGQSALTGREFFELCRQVSSCVPRDPNRKIIRVPAIVSPVAHTQHQRLIRTENVSPGGVFLQDPELRHEISDLLKVRLAGRQDILVQTEIRWLRDRKRPSEPLGYGCAFSDTPDRTLNKLLEVAESAPTIRKSLVVPRK